MKQNENVFTLKEIPFFLNMLLLIVGWFLIQTIDEVTKNPEIEYKITLDKDKKLNCRLTNISDKLFTNLQFKITCRPELDEVNFPSGGTIYTPNSPDENGSTVITDSTCQNALYFPIGKMYPDWSFCIVASFVGDLKDVKLSLGENSKEASGFRLHDNGPITFFIKNKLGVYIFLLVVSFLLWALYVLILIFAKTKILRTVENSTIEAKTPTMPVLITKLKNGKK